MFDRCNTREEAEIYILNWISEVKKTNFESLKSFCKKVLKRLKTILICFDNPISTDLSEGKNNVIISIIKRGYRYRDLIISDGKYYNVVDI